MQHYSLAINNRRPGVLGEITEIVLHHLRDYIYRQTHHSFNKGKSLNDVLLLIQYRTSSPISAALPDELLPDLPVDYNTIQLVNTIQKIHTHTSYIIFICISYIVFTSYIIVANPGHPIQLKSSAVSLTYTVSGLYPKMIDHIYHFTIISLDYYKYIYP